MAGVQVAQRLASGETHEMAVCGAHVGAGDRRCHTARPNLESAPGGTLGVFLDQIEPAHVWNPRYAAPHPIRAISFISPYLI